MQPRTIRTCDESPIHADEAETKMWDAVVRLLDAEKIERAKQRLIERQADESPHAKRIASVTADVERVERKMQRLVRRADDECERGNATVAESYEKEARAAGRELDAVRAERDRLVAEQEQEQGRAATERMQNALASVEQIQRDIAEADSEGRAYVLDRLDVRCMLRHTQKGTLRAIKIESLAGEATVLLGSAAMYPARVDRQKAS